MASWEGADTWRGGINLPEKESSVVSRAEAASGGSFPGSPAPVTQLVNVTYERDQSLGEFASLGKCGTGGIVIAGVGVAFVKVAE